MKKLFLVFIVLSVFVISCGKSEEKGIGKKIAVNLQSEPKSLDPQLASDASGITIDTLLYEGLTRLDKEGKVVPAAAEKWDVSEDGLPWTFHLRDGIKWSGGEPITANDFKFAWLRVLDKNTVSEYAYMLYPIKGARAYNEGDGKREDVAIKVIDDKTLEVVLERPTAYFASLAAYTTYSPVNEKYFNEKGKDFAVEAKDMEYSGPYKIEKWAHDSNFILVKNENYWNKDQIKLDVIEVKLIAESASALNAFTNGEVDLIRLTAEQYSKYEKDERVHVFNNNTVWYLEYNLKNKFLSNKKIRQALTLAIDKDEMVNTILRGSAKSAYGMVPTGFKGKEKSFREENGDVYPHYNPEEAKRLFEEGLKELGMDKAPDISIVINDQGSNKKIAEYVQEKLRTVLNFDLRIEPLPFKERMSKLEQKNYDIALAGWGADYADPMTYMDLWITNGGNNHTSYTNPKYDELIKIANNSGDNTVRMNAMMEAEKILGEDMPIGILTFNTRIAMLNPKVKNVYFKGIGTEFYLYDASID